MKSKLQSYFKEKRKDFPLLKTSVNGKQLIYADNGATNQKPQCVIDSLKEYYETYNSNVHRGIHTLSEKATNRYEEVRKKVAQFLSAEENEIVFTSGTTHALNQVAFGFEHELKQGDEIILTVAEHHANLVPWQEVAKRTGVVLKFIPLTSEYRLDLEKAKELITSKTKIISLAHASNVLGAVNPVKELACLAHENGALLVADGAQAVAHKKIDVKELDCDLYVFSSHKVFGPTGVGVLYGKKEVLERMKPLMYGGDMIDEVKLNESTFNKVPFRFEAGTPNIADVIAFGVALDYLKQLDLEKVEQYEKELTEYFLEKINELGDDFELYGPRTSENRCSVFSFRYCKAHGSDIATFLDQYGIAVRSGHHCAMPLTKELDVNSTARISLSCYNTFEEIDFIIKSLKEIKKLL